MDTPTFGTAAVAAPHDLATRTGVAILAQGGNAIEAMVAMAATIAVVYPHMNAIGGDGFWLVADPKRRVHYIDAAGTAGSGATIRAYRDRGHETIPPRGAEAVITVPGTVDGWRQALDMAKAFGGRLPLDVLLADAIRHARDGAPVAPSMARADLLAEEDLLAAPGFRQTFTTEGRLLKAGETLRQPALAATLEQLAHAGLRDFYAGDVGREMGKDLEAIGAPVTRADLSGYEARFGTALRLTLDGCAVHLTPPPTQGVATGITIGLFERLGVRTPESFEHIHGLIESIKKATLVRDRIVTDPARMVEDPARYLTDRFLGANAAAISLREAAATPTLTADGGTIWMGAIDASGLAVSMIQSVFWDYGSGVVLPATGVLMHNRGRGFSLDPASLNAMEQGRKPFHTLNPAMALFDDGRVMPFGTMGGDAQAQILGQFFSRYRLGHSLASAIDAPRFRLARPWNGGAMRLDVENRFDDTVLRRLERVGHPVVMIGEAYSDELGHTGALVRHPANGRVEAMHDPRSDGGALGL